MHALDSRPHAAPSHARPGVALIMAVIAMAVLGVLVAGVFFAAFREQRDGRDAIRRVQALAAAEYGLAMARSPGSWPSEWKVTARRGPLARFAATPGPATSDSVQIWKLTRNSFLLRSDGVAGSGVSRATRRLALLVTLRVPELAVRAAAVAPGAVRVSDSSLISGLDTVPPGPSCPPTEDERPAVVVPASLLLDDGSCTVASCIEGAPPVLADTLADAAETYRQLGTLDRDTIAAAAQQLVGDAIISAPAPRLDGGGECDIARSDNLGDPLQSLGADSPCGDYLPVVHATGNMRIQGGAAQGLLLVDGDLTLTAGAHFSGVALVRGVLEITEASELHGAALASRVVVRAMSRLRYSSCAVERALRAAAEPVVPEGPAWSEVY